MKQKTSNSIWGLILLLFGIGFAGRALGIWNFSIFFNGWWTLFIIVPCVISIAKEGPKPATTTGLIVGALFLLSSWGLFSPGVIFKMFFPILLIAIGCNMLFKDSIQRSWMKRNGSTAYQSDSPEYSAIFSAQKITCDNEVFTGASLNAIFGGIDLLLKDAYLQEDIVVNCTTVFGGIDIRVPANVNVQVSCVPIFGAVSNKVRNRNPGGPTIFINATCMFGGIDIK